MSLPPADPTALAADARLIILRELARKHDGRLNSTVLSSVLYVYGHPASSDWLETQINALEDVGAIRVSRADHEVVVAAITRAGLDHVHRRRRLGGVAVPSPAVD